MGIDLSWIDKAIISDGTIEITQEMWNNGVRYLAISSHMEEPLQIKISRLVSEELLVYRNTMLLKKVSDTEFYLYNYLDDGRRLQHLFTKYYKKWDTLNYTDDDNNTQQATNVVSSDMWSHFQVRDNSGRYIVQGNTNMIFQKSDESMHTGDQHGLERALFTKFLANGKEWDPIDGDDLVQCDNFKFVSRSAIYRRGGNTDRINDYVHAYPLLDSSGNPIVDYYHFIEATFTSENTIDIVQNLKCLVQTSFKMVNGAMLEAYYVQANTPTQPLTHTFNTTLVNTNEYSINGIDTSGNITLLGGSELKVINDDVNKFVFVNANKVEVIGDSYHVYQDIESINTPDKCVVQSYNYGNRVKFYMNPTYLVLPADGTYRNEINGMVGTVFQAGDNIPVKAHRTIKIT